VNLGGLGGRAPAQLSGGQQQRVALARVLATDPTVLLFDEPLSALDKNLRDTLKYSILDLQRKTRKTAIYVTHDQSEAFAISDRVVVMNAGRIEQIGTQTEIYLHPRTRFVAEFIGANNGLEGTVAGRDPDDDGVVFVTVGALTVRCRHLDPIAVGSPAIVYVRPENISVLGDGDDRPRNIVEGVVDRVIFEGATAQVRVDIGGRELRADVSGEQRLMLDAGSRRVRLGFDDATLIPISAADAGRESSEDGTEPATDGR
jgi:ABC-type Fe3+/spermidine/putrescine transport system ATPase subunit